ncbi:MAG: type VI secretion system Vgr family protein [Gemmataceae bacterium]
MAEKYVSGSRLLTVTTPLGADAFLLHGLSGTEAFSRLFTFTLDLVSHQEDVQPKDIVGKPVTAHVQHSSGRVRHFNGFISRFATGAKLAHGLRQYRAELVPWLWFLTRTSNCRVYSKTAKEATTPEILEAVFKEFGFADFKLDLKRSYAKWKYCVQYRETAFNFVSRLMEQAGMFYYFVQQNGKHTLVISDHAGSYKDCEENSLRYLPSHGHFHTITRWEHEWEFRPGKWAHTDYNFETPSTSLLATTNTMVKLPGVGKYEMFDYPGEYLVKKEGEADVKARMEEDEAPHDVVSGGGHAVSFFPGGKFTMAEHDIGSEAGKKYVLTSVRHSATDTTAASDPEPPTYDNSFTCIPDAVTFRPPRVTPKPTVVGTQPAVVVGPKGQELHTDKYGRVMVQFFWDRDGKRDENSTCWIRVAQVMAGKRWGASFWPRIGQEVLVAFHEGDPDQPVVVGTLYNAEQMPPYQGDGPDGKHKSDNKVSGYKSNTTMGGAGYNEWRFDDTKGKEEIFLHAEKDIDTRVKNDSRELVLNDKHLIVGKDSKGSFHELVHKDRHIHVKAEHHEHVEKDVKLKFDKDVDVVIGATRKDKIAQESHLVVGTDRCEKIGMNQSLTVGMDQNEKVGMNHALEAGMTVHIKAGMTMVIEAGVQLSLKVGGSFIDINPTGVAITGPMVMINSGGAAGSGDGSSPKEPKEAKDAKPVDPNEADDSKTGQKSAP